MSDLKIKKIVEYLAKNITICKNFKDIKVINEKNSFLGYTDIEKKILYLNVGQNFISFSDFIKVLKGLVIHEFGHIDSRLKVPHTLKNHKSNIRKIKRKFKSIDYGLLNILYDLEVHYLYIQKKFIKPLQKNDLLTLLNITRNKIIKKDKKELILSMDFQFSKEQKELKKVIENRKLSIVKKYEKLKKLSKGKEIFNYTFIILVDKKGKKNKHKNLDKNAVSIKEEIEIKHKKGKIEKKLKSFGFSDYEIKNILQKKTLTDLISKIEHLENTFNDILLDFDKAITKSKTKNHLKSFGNRINGYRKIRDISEITENIEDFILVGDYDINDIYVPIKIQRKSKGLIVLIRDTSGSVSDIPLSKIARDLTISLIKLAKIKGFKIGVLDFHSEVEPILDSKGKFITNEYNLIMLDSMKFKDGYSTILNNAIKYVNEQIKKENLENESINIFVISDSYVDKVSEKFNFKKLNLICIDFDINISETHKNFIDFCKDNNGKMFKIKEIEKKLVSTICENI